MFPDMMQWEGHVTSVFIPQILNPCLAMIKQNQTPLEEHTTKYLTGTLEKVSRSWKTKKDGETVTDETKETGWPRAWWAAGWDPEQKNANGKS